MRVRVEADGDLDRTRLWFRAMGRNARELRPLGWKARERWHESETRAFNANRVRWAPHKAGTYERYQRGPIKTINGRRSGRATGRGVGHFTGGLRRALTRPHQPGVYDRVIAGRGRLTFEAGIKAGRAPRVYGRWFEAGTSRRAGREVVVFDDPAGRALAGDTRQHLMPRRWGR